VAGADPRLSTPEWRRLRRLILDRDGNLCRIGGPTCTRYATCVDHIVARADGGDCWDPANLRAACRPCNSAGTNATHRRRFGYLTTLAGYETRF
jgi:5-methylcytosine-specific restriction endonuclease McrA